MWLRRLTAVGVFLCLARSGLNAQSYPLWFLEQEEVLCNNTAVGYASASFYKDSSIVQAYRDAILNLVRSREVSIRGSQAFWTTEIGTAWMGGDFTERFDSAQLFLLQSAVKILDTAFVGNCVVVLVGDSGCEMPSAMRQRILMSSQPQPAWTDSIPQDARYIYAVGMAPEYFYEESSWREAERMARRNLARNVFVHMKSLQKMSAYEGQDVRVEELSVALKNIEVVARWKSINKKIYFLLLRTIKRV